MPPRPDLPTDPPAAASQRRRPRWRGPLGLLTAVLAGHALLLGALPLGWGDGFTGGVTRQALQVRRIEAAPPVPEPAPVPPVPPAAPPPAPRPPTPAVLAAAPPASAAEAAAVAALPEPVARAVATAAPVTAADPASTAAAAAAPEMPASEDGGGRAPPVYATKLPPPAVLHYELKRGALGGSGELSWRWSDGHYEATMLGTAFGLSVLNWVSRGAIDGAGLAPERFVDRRRGRDVRAANFQRDKGLITFSGPQVEYPLWPGAQDRLSWMLQLAAIVDAAPSTFTPGEKIVMFVAGARGDGDVWTFTVEGSEAIELPIGNVAHALRLRREPRKPFDTRGEVWLDPARSHLPVRVRLTVVQTDESTEFLLREAGTP